MNKLLTLLLLTIVMLSSCRQSSNKEKTAQQSNNENPVTTRYTPEKNGKVLAKVNGVPIYEDQLKGRPLQFAVIEEILYQAGLKQGIGKKYQEKVMAYQKSLVVRDMENSILKNLPPGKIITDQELLNYYNENKDSKFTQVHFAEITFSDKDLGVKILKMAKEGKQLKDIAATLSKSGAKVTVKDLGFNRTLSKYFKVKNVGALSDIIDYKNGTYSIMKIVNVRTIPFEDVKRTLSYTYLAREKEKAYAEYAEKIAKKDGMKIEIVGEPEQR